MCSPGAAWWRPASLVDKVHPGLEVELIFSACNASSTPQIPGRVSTVLTDRLVDEKTGMPYYKVSASGTHDGVRMMAANKMEVRLGMPVELFVKTGERTMMSYLFKPLFHRAKAAMTAMTEE